MALRVAFGSCGAGAAVLGVGYWYRLQGLPADDLVSKPPRPPNTSVQTFTDNADRPIPFALELARKATLFLGVSIARAWLTLAGDFSIQTDDNYWNFVEAVQCRDPQTPLLTISNHRSLIDDPCVFSSLLPYTMNVQPKYVRYSLCAQEYCYNDKLPALVHGIVGMGKVLPILRGAGINQSLLLDYAHLAAAGQWVHMFPEGGIWQMPVLGGRKGSSAEANGKLKWGVGKIIAHCPQRPKVIVFYFSGLDTAIPQHPETKAVESFLPKPGHQVRVRFSEEVSFDDLLAEHEAQHGRLWRYQAHAQRPASGAARDLTDSPELLVAGERWVSTEHELQLYSRIALRVEQVLAKLNEQANQELGLDSHA